MNLAQADQIVAELLDALRPACEREYIVSAGSVRRRKLEPKDVEIVFVPRLVQRRVDLFTYGDVPATDEVIANLVSQNVLAWDEEVRRNGQKYKRLIHVASGVTVDLFAATLERWGFVLALRTGPDKFNRLLVTKRRYGGAMPAGMRMQDGHLWRDLERLESHTEEEFFAQIGVPCWSPEQRSVEQLRMWLEETMTRGVCCT